MVEEKATGKEKRAIRTVKMARRACSRRWADDIREGRTEYPIPGMVLSVAFVADGGSSNNKGTVGKQRFTPPGHNGGGVALEDRLDLMSIAEANRYEFPSAIRYDYMAGYMRGQQAIDPINGAPTFTMLPVCYQAMPVDDDTLQVAKLVDWPEFHRLRVRMGYARQIVETTGRRVRFQRIPETPIVALY